MIFENSLAKATKQAAVPLQGLARLCTVPGVTASVNVVSCIAVSVVESTPTAAPSLTVPSRLTHSLSLMSHDDVRFTRQGLLLGWLEKLQTQRRTHTNTVLASA